MSRLRIVVAVLLLSALPRLSYGQTDSWLATAASDFDVTSNITYLTASGQESKLDVFVPKGSGPHPTILHIHGGGWRTGARAASRADIVLRLLPYLRMGFAVVNVDYRLREVAPAPAAAEDCMCALRWIAQNAKTYNFDLTRLVTMGYSAGGELALLDAIAPASLGLDAPCASTEPLPRVAAVVNWYGVLDLAEQLDGPYVNTGTLQWIGGRPDRLAEAKRLSPMTYARKDVPPIITIHGDADQTVPYHQATAFTDALKKAGADTELVTMAHGGHGTFSHEEQLRAARAVAAFLERHGLMPAQSGRSTSDSQFSDHR